MYSGLFTVGICNKIGDIQEQIKYNAIQGQEQQDYVLCMGRTICMYVNGWWAMYSEEGGG